MKRFFSAAALTAALLSSSASAQKQGSEDSSSNNEQTLPRATTFPLWKAELPGGSYIIARNSINAVSMQQYLLDGVARVTEVNISTAGVFQPRFYYLENITPDAPANIPGAQLVLEHAQKLAEEAASHVSQDDAPWKKVIKNYPSTTHAGTIEFRLDTLQQLQKLFESVERTWLTGKSEVYTPQGVRPFNPDEELKNKDADDDSAGEGGPGSGGSSGGGN